VTEAEFITSKEIVQQKMEIPNVLKDRKKSVYSNSGSCNIFSNLPIEKILDE